MKKYSDYVKEQVAAAQKVAEALGIQLTLAVAAGSVSAEEAQDRLRMYVKQQTDIIMTSAKLLVDVGLLERDVEHVKL